MARTSHDQVKAALTELARRDQAAADNAQAAFESVTFGEGLEAVSMYGLQNWLWYQLPVKWSGDLDDHRRRAEALGDLFEQLQMPRYATVCTSQVTADVLTAWDQDHNTGFAAFEKAMTTSGVQPPDIDGLLAWSHVQGMDENTAMNTTAIRLEMAIAAGDLTPGRRGWRGTARNITAEYLTAPRSDLDGRSWLDLIHAERLEHWVTSRGSARAALTEQIAPRLATAPAVADDAETVMAPIRWLLDRAITDGGIPLTANHTLARAVVAEGTQRFDWLTGAGRPRSEADIPEAWTLRELLRQIGAVRRHKLRLVLTPTGKALASADTSTLWAAVTNTLIPTDRAEAAAAEITLMLHLTGFTGGYYEQRDAVAEAMAGEGWHEPGTGTPIRPNDVGWLIGALHRRLSLLGLFKNRHGLTGEGDHLTSTGDAAAHAAVRFYALRPRTEVGFG